ALFRDLARLPPDNTADLERLLPGLEEGERFCRQVICFVKSELSGQPPERLAAELAVLEAELQAHRDRSRKVSLPDPRALRHRLSRRPGSGGGGDPSRPPACRCP